ncbi:MAG: hypothetical protein AB3N14_01565 [Flavobacteriaceae bacterium]
MKKRINSNAGNTIVGILIVVLVVAAVGLAISPKIRDKFTVTMEKATQWNGHSIAKDPETWATKTLKDIDDMKRQVKGQQIEISINKADVAEKRNIAVHERKVADALLKELVPLYSTIPDGGTLRWRGQELTKAEVQEQIIAFGQDAEIRSREQNRYQSLNDRLEVAAKEANAQLRDLDVQRREVDVTLREMKSLGSSAVANKSIRKRMRDIDAVLRQISGGVDRNSRIRSVDAFSEALPTDQEETLFNNLLAKYGGS